MYDVGQKVAVRLSDNNTGEGSVLAVARNDSGCIYKVAFPEMPPRWWSANQVFAIIAPAEPNPDN